MDESGIDQAYDQLQVEFKELAASLEALARKLQIALQTGDIKAREWLLDLKQVALDVRAEQMQVNELLSAVHSYVAGVHTEQLQSQPTYQQVPVQPARGGMGGLLHGRFGQAVEMGAGFAVGEDLINSIF